MYWRQRTALRRGRRARALCAPFFCFTSTKGGPIPRSLPARPYLRPGGHIPVGNKNTTGCRLQCKRMTRNHQCWTRVPLVSLKIWIFRLNLKNYFMKPLQISGPCCVIPFGVVTSCSQVLASSRILHLLVFGSFGFIVSIFWAH